MKIKLVKQLHSCAAAMCTEGDRWVELEVDMPSCPGIGWHVMDEVITEASFNIVSGFRFFVEPDKTYYNLETFGCTRATKEQMDAVVMEYVAKGWAETTMKASFNGARRNLVRDFNRVARLAKMIRDKDDREGICDFMKDLREDVAILCCMYSDECKDDMDCIIDDVKIEEVE